MDATPSAGEWRVPSQPLAELPSSLDHDDAADNLIATLERYSN